MVVMVKEEEEKKGRYKHEEEHVEGRTDAMSFSKHLICSHVQITGLTHQMSARSTCHSVFAYLSPVQPSTTSLLWTSYSTSADEQEEERSLY